MTKEQIIQEFSRLKNMQRDLRIYEILHGNVCAISFLRKHVLEQMRRLAKLVSHSSALLLVMCLPVLGQKNHDVGHIFYKGWVNKADRNCCNNDDCGVLGEGNERTTANGGIEVFVLGTWCPIKPHHYLKSGNAPDWSVTHVCVLKTVPWQIIAPCDRLLCYQPKPGI